MCVLVVDWYLLYCSEFVVQSILFQIQQLVCHMMHITYGLHYYIYYCWKILYYYYLNRYKL